MQRELWYKLILPPDCLWAAMLRWNQKIHGKWKCFPLGYRVQPSPRPVCLTTGWGHNSHEELLEGRVGGQWLAGSSRVTCLTGLPPPDPTGSAWMAWGFWAHTCVLPKPRLPRSKLKHCRPRGCSSRKAAPNLLTVNSLKQIGTPGRLSFSCKISLNLLKIH